MKVLVADDDPVLRLSISSLLLRLGYEVVSARDGLEAWNVLQQDDPPRLAIVDWMMPKLDGLELCSRLRAATDRRYTYVLLLTSKNERQDVITGLDSGADDYLTKPAEMGELDARLRVGKRIVGLQDELLRAYEEKRFEASHDSLTTLWNRKAILELLSNQFARTCRDGTSLAVMIIDVDHFKNINDAHGHVVGDSVLREIASRMTSSTRQYDWIGRYGGEEFIIIAPDCMLAGASAIAERVRYAIASVPIVVDRQQINVTVSVGMATTAESGVTSEHDLICAADAAMYRAKKQGRNRIESTVRNLPVDKRKLRRHIEELRTQ